MGSAEDGATEAALAYFPPDVLQQTSGVRRLGPETYSLINMTHQHPETCRIIRVNSIMCQNERFLGGNWEGRIFVVLQTFSMSPCECVSAGMWSTAYIACLNVHIAWNNQANTAQARGSRQPAAVHFSPPYVFVKNICCAPSEGRNQSKCYISSCSILKAAKSYWYLPDQPTLSKKTTGHQWHLQTDHLVSSVRVSFRERTERLKPYSPLN